MSVPYTPPVTLTNGTTADATQVMANFNAITTSLAGAAASGANSDITSLTGLTTPIAPGTSGGSSVYWGGTATGTGNAQVIATPVPSGFALTAGNRIQWLPLTNTGATQINVNGQGLTNLYRRSPAGPIACAGGETFSGQLAEAEYDGTQFILEDNPAQLGGYGPVQAIASATTTDLGTITSHYASITGTTTITSFGVSGTTLASTDFPFYRVAFAGSLTLTYNATSMILPGAANIQTAAGDTADVVYGGGSNWAVIRYNRAASPPGAGALAGANTLVITNNQAQQVTVTFNSAVLVNSSGYPIFSGSQTLTINMSTTGANGLDTGSQAANTWYYVYAISNGSTVAGIVSAVAPPTGPALPAGYTFVAYLGAVRGGASTVTLLNTKQVGNRAQYIIGASGTTTAMPAIKSSALGSFWTAQSVTLVVPTTATRATVQLYASFQAATGAAGVAPNTNYGSPGTLATPFPPLMGVSTGGGSNYTDVKWADIALESTSVYTGQAGSPTAAAVYCLGWTDAVNAC